MVVADVVVVATSVVVVGPVVVVTPSSPLSPACPQAATAITAMAARIVRARIPTSVSIVSPAATSDKDAVRRCRIDR